MCRLVGLRALLCDEHDAAVLEAIADAFGCMWDHRCVAPLLPLAEHEHRDVRLAATRALFACNNDDRAALAALVRLTGDVDGEIRDWATFALAGGDADSSATCDAVWERINDPAGDTSSEALLGLANRKDPRAEGVVAQLLTDNPGNLIVEAAAELAAPALYPLLLAVRDSGWQNDDPRAPVLDEALRACMPPRPARRPDTGRPPAAQPAQ